MCSLARRLSHRAGPFLAATPAVQFKAELRNHGGHPVIRLSGALCGQMSTELIGLVEASQPPVQLDLSELITADVTGLRTLVSLEARGSELVRASPYMSLQLDGVRQTARADTTRG
jgi:hypothetical protein